MGRLRSIKKADLPMKRKEPEKKQLTAYRATRLWNQVVNGFKRFMPLKTHRVLFQYYEGSFKREDGQRWLIEFIKDSELLKPISMENAGLLLDKFTAMGIIEQVCTSKTWLRTPTVIYKFSSVDQSRVEKLRTLRYYSHTPIKGTTVDVTTPTQPVSHPIKSVHPSESVGPPSSGEKHRPLAPRTNLLQQYEASPAPVRPRPEGSGKENRDKLCTPCKKRKSEALPRNPMFSSTPNKDDISPYTRALETIRKSRDIARRLQNNGNSTKTGVKRLAHRGPHTRDLLGNKKKERNSVIEDILEEFDELISAIDQAAATKRTVSQ